MDVSYVPMSSEKLLHYLGLYRRLNSESGGDNLGVLLIHPERPPFFLGPFTQTLGRGGTQSIGNLHSGVWTIILYCFSKAQPLHPCAGDWLREILHNLKPDSRRLFSTKHTIHENRFGESQRKSSQGNGGTQTKLFPNVDLS